MIRHLFWDFDGTLYDSYPRMLKCLEIGLNDLGYGDRFTTDELFKLIKVNVGYAIEQCAGKIGLPTEEVQTAFKQYHSQARDFTPYQGLRECLQTLHAAGCRHYLYTHRNQVAIEQLEKDGLWPLFTDSVVSNDGFPLKPAPDALLALMERHHLAPEECAMIGDRDIDIDAGHNAGMSGFLFDPMGFYAGYPSELQALSMAELAQKILAQ